MRLSIEKLAELTEMQFNDHFELPEPKKYEEDDCCMFCGNEIPNLKIWFNDKEQLFKYECSNCDAIYVLPQKRW